jgi:WD40 repeat protein
VLPPERTWNLEDSNAVLELPKTSVTALAFSADGKNIAIGCSDGTIRLWNFGTTGVKVVKQRNSNPITDIAFSTKHLVAADIKGNIHIWNAATFKLLRSTPRAGSLLALSDDGKTLATSSDELEIKTWNLAAWKGFRTILRKPEDFAGGLKALVFSPDGSILCAAGDEYNPAAALPPDGLVWFIEPATGKLLKDHINGFTIQSVAFSKDGRYFVEGHQNHPDESTGGKFEVFSRYEHLELRHLFTRLEREPVSTVALSSEGSCVAAISDRAILSDLPGGNPLGIFAGQGKIRCLAFSPKGHLLATGSEDGSTALWDYESLNPWK